MGQFQGQTLASSKAFPESHQSVLSGKGTQHPQIHPYNPLAHTSTLLFLTVGKNKASAEAQWSDGPFRAEPANRSQHHPSP